MHYCMIVHTHTRYCVCVLCIVCVYSVCVCVLCVGTDYYGRQIMVYVGRNFPASKFDLSKVRAISRFNIQ